MESLEDSATPPNLVGIPVDDITDKLKALFDRGPLPMNLRLGIPIKVSNGK